MITRIIDDEILTGKEVCGILKISQESLYRYVAAGLLPSIRFSPKLLRFRRSDIESVLEKKRSNAPAMKKKE